MNADRRRELRFKLVGSLDGLRFFSPGAELEPLAVDVSRNGMALVFLGIPTSEALQKVRIAVEDDETLPVTLELRNCRALSESPNHRSFRCGYELSELDKERGADLLTLLHAARNLRVRLNL